MGGLRAMVTYHDADLGDGFSLDTILVDLHPQLRSVTWLLSLRTRA